MSDQNDRELREFLKRNMPPVHAESDRDLWPQLLRRIDERSSGVPWFDWALLAFLALWLFFSPGAIPVLLYHL